MKQAKNERESYKSLEKETLNAMDTKETERKTSNDGFVDIGTGGKEKQGEQTKSTKEKINIDNRIEGESVISFREKLFNTEGGKDDVKKPRGGIKEKLASLYEGIKVRAVYENDAKDYKEGVNNRQEKVDKLSKILDSQDKKINDISMEIGSHNKRMEDLKLQFGEFEPVAQKEADKEKKKLEKALEFAKGERTKILFEGSHAEAQRNKYEEKLQAIIEKVNLFVEEKTVQYRDNIDSLRIDTEQLDDEIIRYREKKHELLDNIEQIKQKLSNAKLKFEKKFYENMINGVYSELAIADDLIISRQEEQETKNKKIKSLNSKINYWTDISKNTSGTQTSPEAEATLEEIKSIPNDKMNEIKSKIQKGLRQPSGSARAKIEKDRTLSDAEFLKGGAEYKLNKEGNTELHPTYEQISEREKEMEDELIIKNYEKEAGEMNNDEKTIYDAVEEYFNFINEKNGLLNEKKISQEVFDDLVKQGSEQLLLKHKDIIKKIGDTRTSEIIYMQQALKKNKNLEKKQDVKNMNKQETTDGGSGNIESELNEQKQTFKIGDEVLWESQGVLQWKEPRRIKSFEEDPQSKRKYALFENENTGVPLEELSSYKKGATINKQRNEGGGSDKIENNLEGKEISADTYIKIWNNLFSAKLQLNEDLIIDILDMRNMKNKGISKLPLKRIEEGIIEYNNRQKITSEKLLKNLFTVVREDESLLTKEN